MCFSKIWIIFSRNEKKKFHDVNLFLCVLTQILHLIFNFFPEVSILLRAICFAWFFLLFGYYECTTTTKNYILKISFQNEIINLINMQIEWCDKVQVLFVCMKIRIFLIRNLKAQKYKFCKMFKATSFWVTRRFLCSYVILLVFSFESKPMQ